MNQSENLLRSLSHSERDKTFFSISVIVWFHGFELEGLFVFVELWSVGLWLLVSVVLFEVVWLFVFEMFVFEMFVFVSGLFVFGVIWLVFEMFVFRVSELGVLCVLFFSRFPLSSSNLPSFSSFPLFSLFLPSL